MPRWSLRLITTLGLVVLVSLFALFIYAPRDPKQCNMSYSRPIYVQQTTFDTSWSALAKKYRLYLYREGGIDYRETVNRGGQPVLFIPGHAGSYKQSRSIASETTVQLHALLNQQPGDDYAKLDFFTLDFNEELSAIYGPTLLSQAQYTNDAIRYILSQYKYASSVIIVGHSMGGVVARILPLLPNYTADSLNTLITLATPHSTPPVFVDQTISQIYKDITSFWQRESQNGSLKEVALLSVAGGNLDAIVASDTSSVHGIIPPSHGFSVYSTGIPQVWTGADHMAILWCNQLVQRVSTAIIKMVQPKVPYTTKPLHSRVNIFRKLFLTTLDDSTHVYSLGAAVTKNFDSTHIHTTTKPNLYFHSSSIPSTPLILDARTFGTLEFRLTAVTDQNTSIKAYVCRHVTATNELKCQSIMKNSVTLPSYQPGQTIVSVHIPHLFLQNADYIYAEILNIPKDGFLKTQFYNTTQQLYTYNVSMTGIALQRSEFEFPHMESGMMSFPRLNNPLFRYKLSLFKSPGPDCIDDTFPVIRMSVKDRYESKYFTDISKPIHLAFHGESAFASNQHLLESGLQLQVWNQPKCPLQVQIKLDIFSSLGRIMMQHGIVLAVLPLMFSILVFLHQVTTYEKTGSMPSWTATAEKQYPRFFSIGACVLVGISFIQICYHSGTGARDESVFPTYFPAMIDQIGLGVASLDIVWPSLILLLSGIGVLALIIFVLRFTVSIISKTLNVIQGPRGGKPHSPHADQSACIIIWTIATMLISRLILPQLLFVVAFVLQLFICSKTLTASSLQETQHDLTLSRYQFSILVILFSLLPFYAPAALVWTQDLFMGWYEFPSSSSLPHTLHLAALVSYLTSLRQRGGVTLPKFGNLYGTMELLLIMCGFAFGIRASYAMSYVASLLWIACQVQTKLKLD